MSTVHRLSRADARRVAVRAQLLARPRPTDLLDTGAVDREIQALADWLDLALVLDPV